MNRKEKIDKIYEVIADKTLSFGCKFTLQNLSRLKVTNRGKGRWSYWKIEKIWKNWHEFVILIIDQKL